MLSFFPWITAWGLEIKENFFLLPLSIQGAIIVSLIAMTGTLMIYTGVLLLRGIKYYHEKRERPLGRKIDALLLEHVITPPLQYHTSAEEIRLRLDEFRQLPLHTAWGRRLFVQKLLYGRRNFTGDTALLLRKLYLELQLHTFAEQRIRSGNAGQVVEGLKELFNMDAAVNEAEIWPLLNSRNRYVQEMARCYFAKCAVTDQLAFLGGIKKPLKQWEQFELFRIISQRTDTPTPSFAPWIDEAFHPTVIAFCIKLATHFQQFDAIPAIINLLQTPHLQLRALAINSLGKLVAIEAEPLLVAMYELQPLACKLEVLKALGRIGSGEQLAFLKQVFLEADSFDLQKNACRSMVSHKALAGHLLEELQSHCVGQHRVILEHSMNPLIKY